MNSSSETSHQLSSPYFLIMKDRVLYNLIEKKGLLFCPAILREVILLQAKPLEHTAFGCDSGDEIGNILPICFFLNKASIYHFIFNG